MAPAIDLDRPEDVTRLRAALLAGLRRNLATDGFVLSWNPAERRQDGAVRYSAPGCFIASPSYPTEQRVAGGAPLDQDYVFCWTRDAALAAVELAADEPPPGEADSQRLADYVTFSARCQDAAAADADTAHHDIGHPMYYVDGTPYPRGPQYDGPPLQALAVLRAYDLLPEATRATARSVVERNVQHVLDHLDTPSESLWEERTGFSFFTRAAQLRCLREARARQADLSLDLPDTTAAEQSLTAALDTHWDPARGVYLSMLDVEDYPEGYDPNIDIVMAAVYGAASATDPKVLATAAALRTQWADPAAPTVYPINVTDAPGLGPLLGRYPGDVYDGDTTDQNQGHPWALCTANYAAYCYTVAAALRSGALSFPVTVPAFFTGLGAAPTAGGEAEAADRLRAAGDRMLLAVVHHADHLELSEQFDQTTGYEKSVANLSWSYSAFLNALRARG